MFPFDFPCLWPNPTSSTSPKSQPFSTPSPPKHHPGASGTIESYPKRGLPPILLGGCFTILVKNLLSQNVEVWKSFRRFSELLFDSSGRIAEPLCFGIFNSLRPGSDQPEPFRPRQFSGPEFEFQVKQMDRAKWQFCRCKTLSHKKRQSSKGMMSKTPRSSKSVTFVQINLPRVRPVAKGIVDNCGLQPSNTSWCCFYMESKS